MIDLKILRFQKKFNYLKKSTVSKHYNYKNKKQLILLYHI